MGYWIFQDQEHGQCTAVADECLENHPISDELGELLHEGPMPAIIAKMYVARFGGRVVEPCSGQSAAA